MYGSKACQNGMAFLASSRLLGATVAQGGGVARFAAPRGLAGTPGRLVRGLPGPGPLACTVYRTGLGYGARAVGRAGVARPARRPIKKLCKSTQLALPGYTTLCKMKV
jgi:hypothetical protein